MREEIFSRLIRFLYETCGVYGYCLGLDGREIADVYCSTEEERAYLFSIITKEECRHYLEGATNNFVEEIIPVFPNADYMVCQGIMVKVNNEPKGLFFVGGIVERFLPENEEIPDVVKRIEQEKYNQLIPRIKGLMDLFIQADYQLKESLNRLEEAEISTKKLKNDYARGALLTDIVQMLESDKDIVEIVEDVFQKTCLFLEVEGASLYRIDQNHLTASMICEWTKEERWRMMDKEQDVLLSDYPFMGEENYIISSNMDLRPDQKAFMEKKGYSAHIVLPVYLKEEVIMYLTFSCFETTRVWKMDNVRLLSDIRKIVQSIIHKRVAQNSLSSSLSSLEEILENMGTGVIVVNPDNRELLFKNHVVEGALLEYLEKSNMTKFFATHEMVTEVEIHDLSLWVELHRAKIRWVDGSLVELYTLYDISQSKIAEKTVEKSKNSDFLTGLYNRMRCEQDLSVFLDIAKENRGKGAVFFMDLDDFKHINEGLGHQYGDILLKAISSNLRRIPGIESTCYRVGGDEFIVIVTHSNYDHMFEILDNIEEIFHHPWYLKDGEYYCTMSMGICKFPDDADTVEEIIRKADLALVDAKNSGKNQTEFYSDRTSQTDAARLDMEKHMRDAVLHPEEEFEVFYQPIMDISREEDPCVGAEALIRWNSKEMGKICPSDFIPLAEYLGLIKPLGDFVLQQACENCKRWNDLGHPNYKVNVNFSVVQLLQNDVKGKIKKVLEETGLNPKNLTIEVTESLAINDLNYMKKVLGSIKELGVRVALDDFGTGYSSLNRIREMDIDIIKVDRCFVKDVGEDQYSKVFIKMVSELAKTMKLNVCVEGVEDEAQYRIMKEEGINMIQGFYFAEPMKLSEFETKFL